MKTSLPRETAAAILAGIDLDRDLDPRRAVTDRRQPVHTVYGGAHLFHADTVAKLGAIALRSFNTYAAAPSDLADVLGIPEAGELAHAVHDRVMRKLRTEPVEDYRIDFEDGYGFRADDEEDRDAQRCAGELARGMRDQALPPFVGFRVKPFGGPTARRGLRTLDIFLTALAEQADSRLPDNFVIALPKVDRVESVLAFIEAISTLETTCGFDPGSITVELMVETPRAIIGHDGCCALPGLVEAAAGRCVAAHFGAYDYTAACDVTAAHQSLHHDACVFARNMMQAALSGSGVNLVDGATNILPIEPHRAAKGSPPLTDEQRLTNRTAVHDAWKLSCGNIRRSLAAGFYQGWDLHPAQLPIRYAATYCFFLQGLPEASRRLGRFIEQAAQATRVGNVFDDAATGQGLVNFFLRAIDCGAIAEDALQDIGLSAEELRSRSFMMIAQQRQ
ncbi:MAG: hypothetical protein KAS72_08165 [Phycisphaerales bacterium]|nr:hypothetical protein [Phycisphaerales bacterium]